MYHTSFLVQHFFLKIIKNLTELVYSLLVSHEI